jgi:aarF domain-containing kinase
VPFKDVKIVIENDFGCKIDTIYSSFEEIPVAAASLAQVHKAILKDSGKEVAVKVQFPTLYLQTKYDMLVTKAWVHIIGYTAKKLGNESINFEQLFINFRKSCLKELDFSMEYDNAIKTSENFKNEDMLYIPYFYPKIWCKRVLTMEFIDNAFKIDQADEIMKKYGTSLTQKYVCQTLNDVFVKQIFEHGHVHVDGHPGNILVREHPKHKGRPQVVLLDHGHYMTVDDEFRLKFKNLWYALVTFDITAIKRISYELGINEYYRYLPLLLMYWFVDSKKFLKYGSDLYYDKIGFLLQLLP